MTIPSQDGIPSRKSISLRTEGGPVRRVTQHEMQQLVRNRIQRARTSAAGMVGRHRSNTHNSSPAASERILNAQDTNEGSPIKVSNADEKDDVAKERPQELRPTVCERRQDDTKPLREDDDEREDCNDSVTVKTETEGTKQMSQEQISEFVRSKIKNARTRSSTVGGSPAESKSQTATSNRASGNDAVSFALNDTPNSPTAIRDSTKFDDDVVDLTERRFSWSSVEETSSDHDDSDSDILLSKPRDEIEILRLEDPSIASTSPSHSHSSYMSRNRLNDLHQTKDKEFISSAAGPRYSSNGLKSPRRQRTSNQVGEGSLRNISPRVARASSPEKMETQFDDTSAQDQNKDDTPLSPGAVRRQLSPRFKVGDLSFSGESESITSTTKSPRLPVSPRRLGPRIGNHRLRRPSPRFNRTYSKPQHTDFKTLSQPALEPDNGVDHNETPSSSLAAGPQCPVTKEALPGGDSSKTTSEGTSTTCTTTDQPFSPQRASYTSDDKETALAKEARSLLHNEESTTKVEVDTTCTETTGAQERTTNNTPNMGVHHSGGEVEQRQSPCGSPETNSSLLRLSLLKMTPSKNKNTASKNESCSSPSGTDFKAFLKETVHRAEQAKEDKIDKIVCETTTNARGTYKTDALESARQAFDKEVPENRKTTHDASLGLCDDSTKPSFSKGQMAHSADRKVKEDGGDSFDSDGEASVREGSLLKNFDQDGEQEPSKRSKHVRLTECDSESSKTTAWQQSKHLSLRKPLDLSPVPTSKRNQRENEAGSDGKQSENDSPSKTSLWLQARGVSPTSRGAEDPSTIRYDPQDGFKDHTDPSIEIQSFSIDYGESPMTPNEAQESNSVECFLKKYNEDAEQESEPTPMTSEKQQHQQTGLPTIHTNFQSRINQHGLSPPHAEKMTHTHGSQRDQNINSLGLACSRQQADDYIQRHQFPSPLRHVDFPLEQMNTVPFLGQTNTGVYTESNPVYAEQDLQSQPIMPDNWMPPIGPIGLTYQGGLLVPGTLTNLADQSSPPLGDQSHREIKPRSRSLGGPSKRLAAVPCEEIDTDAEKDKQTMVMAGKSNDKKEPVAQPSPPLPETSNKQSAKPKADTVATTVDEDEGDTHSTSSLTIGTEAEDSLFGRRRGEKVARKSKPAPSRGRPIVRRPPRQKVKRELEEVISPERDDHSVCLIQGHSMDTMAFCTSVLGVMKEPVDDEFSRIADSSRIARDAITMRRPKGRPMSLRNIASSVWLGRITDNFDRAADQLNETMNNALLSLSESASDNESLREREVYQVGSFAFSQGMVSEMTTTGAERDEVYPSNERNKLHNRTSHGCAVM
ncbi:hypothetical protein ACA910_022132 [Epithemia clementina (nom. ined.)]